MRTAMGAVATLTALAAPAARAAEDAPSVVVHAPAGPTCVVSGELTEMLRRAGVQSVTSSAGAEGAAELEVKGTPEGLTVRVRGGGRDATSRLPATECATATDVVAAFIVSMFVPVPGAGSVASVASDPLSEGVLEEAVKRELARRGVQLATIGRKLRIRRDDSGTFFLTLEASGAPECSRTTPLGVVETASPLRVAAVSDTMSDALKLQDDCVAGVRGVDPKLAALREAVSETKFQAVATTVLGGLELASGALMFGFLADPDNDQFDLSYSTARDGFLVSASIVAMGGGAASFVVGDDLKPAVVGVTGFASLGAVFTAATIENEYDKTDYALAVLAAANYSTAALMAASAFMHRPPIARFRAFKDELDGPRPRGESIARAERDVARLSTPIPRAVTFAPLAVGSVIAMVPAVLSGFEDRNSNAVAGAGLAFVVPGMLGVFAPDTYTRYRRSLEDAGIRDISLGVGPGDRGGVSLSGRF